MVNDKDGILSVIWEYCRDCPKTKNLQVQIALMTKRIDETNKDVDKLFKKIDYMTWGLVVQLLAIIGFLAAIVVEKVV